MKKNVIALAVAAAMAAPLAAQAEVSVTGGLQAELRSVGGDGTSLNKGLYATDGGEYGSENGGSYGFLKFSASEDLGGGMKALAMWNGVANVGDSSAAGGISGRDAYVGLTGGFGTVLAGTLSTPYKSSTVSWDPFVMTSLQARGNGGMTDLHNGYASNALAYANKFGPATVVIALVLDEGDSATAADETNGEHAKSISVNAPVGPVEVAFAYVDASKFSDINNLGLGATATALGIVTADTVTATKLGVKWNSGAITVAGQYEMLELGNATTIKPTQTYVTASYAMGANTLSAGYGIYDDDTDGTDNTTYMAIGVKHAFSKATSLTAGYRATDADGATDENTVSVGLRVGF
jgi:predicted porin